MKLTIHTPSALVGAALVTLVGLLSAQQLVNSPQVDVRIVQPRLDDHARNAVRIVDGAPYVVPAGKLLVITALGRLDGVCALVELRINGSLEIMRRSDPCLAPTNPLTMESVAPGLVAQAGDTVEVLAFGFGRAWGYLIDQ